MFDKVLQFFKEICSIPHGSGNTDYISDYCVNFAVSHGLKCIRDKIGNVIIYKSGSVGYETSRPVILQGHLDMVCVSDEKTTIDFKKDGLTLCEDSDFIWAKGTSLGGDDGIAIAYALAVLDSESIPHPALEVVFTVDEETGMDGAQALDTALLSSNMLINIDSEDEGTLLVSCAGGIRADAVFTKERCAENCDALKITLSDLTGGHSGTEINKGRLNAVVTLANLLENQDIKLVSISGGFADNVIPSACEAVVICENPEKTKATVQADFDKIKSENKHNEPNMTLTFSNETAQYAFDKSFTSNLFSALSNVPNGIIAISKEVDGLVQTSLNLGTIETKDNKINICHALRSSVQEDKTELSENLKNHYSSFGAQTTFFADYPAWEYRKNSRLRDTFLSSYKELYGKEMNVSAIHAGLECGIFCGKVKNLDCVSFGPDIFDIHSFDEKLSKKSAERTFNLLLKVLEKLN